MKTKFQVEFVLDSKIDLTTEANLARLEVQILSAMERQLEGAQFNPIKVSQLSLKAKARIIQTYLVTAKVTTLATMKIDAYSEDQAEEIAERMDGGDFISQEEGGDWEIDSIEEI